MSRARVSGSHQRSAHPTRPHALSSRRRRLSALGEEQGEHGPGPRGKGRRRVAGGVEGSAQPVLAFLGMATQPPEPPLVAAIRGRAWRRARPPSPARPACCRARCPAARTTRLVRTPQPDPGCLGEVRQVLGVAAVRVLPLLAVAQPVQRVRAESLQEPEPRGAALVVVGQHEGLVDQPAHQVEDIEGSTEPPEQMISAPSREMPPAQTPSRVKTSPLVESRA